MKKKLRRIFALILSITTLLACAHLTLASSANASFENSYGIPWGDGTVKICLQAPGEEISAGVYSDPTPLPGIVFDVYQVWSLDYSPSTGGIPQIKDAFKSVLNQDMLDGLRDVATVSGDSAVLPFPDESTRKLAQTDLRQAASSITPDYKTEASDANGNSSIDLPYGGYLFVPESTFKINDAVYTVDAFLVSLPGMVSAENEANPIGKYSAVVDASPKPEIHVQHLQIRKISILKGENGVATIGRLGGALFEIRDSEGNVVIGSEFTSNHAEDFYFKLNPGKGYRLVELSSPEGYPDGEEHLAEVVFDFDEDGNVIIQNTNIPHYTYVEQDGVLCVFNSIVPRKPSDAITVIKVDEEGNSMKGVVLAIEEEYEPNEWWTAAEFDANTPFTFKEVSRGFNYRIVELETPDGYDPIEDVIFHIDKDTGKVVLDKQNAQVSVDGTGLKITVVNKKTDTPPPETNVESASETMSEEPPTTEPPTSTTETETKGTNPPTTTTVTPPPSTTPTPIQKLTDAVRTGDTTQLALYVVLLLVSAGIIVFVLKRRKKK